MAGKIAFAMAVEKEGEQTLCAGEIVVEEGLFVSREAVDTMPCCGCNLIKDRRRSARQSVSTKMAVSDRRGGVDDSRSKKERKLGQGTSESKMAEDKFTLLPFPLFLFLIELGQLMALCL